MDRQVTGHGGCEGATGDARRTRRGVAFVAVLLLGVAIVLLGHAVVVIGLATERGARNDVRSAELDALLTARLVSTARELASLEDPLPDGVEGRRLSPELLRLRADSAGRGRAALVWAPDPQTRLDALDGGVRSAEPLSLAASGRVASESDACGAGIVVPDGFLDAVAGPWVHESPLAVGPLDSADWVDLPTGPRVGNSGPAAWRTDGDLTLGSGTWDGLLVVFGSLELGAGAHVLGWVATTGDLVVRDGATARGVVRVGGAVDIDTGGRIDVAPCRAVESLVGLPYFAFPITVDPGPWVTDPGN